MKKGIKLILIILVFLFFSYSANIPLYPCKSSPVIAKPVYTWKLCNMNAMGRVNWVGVHEKYFGINEYGRYIGLFLNLAIAFLIIGLLSKLCKKNEHKRTRKKRK